MALYSPCPYCGSNNDHGETCDCQKPAPRPEPPHCRLCGLTAAEIPHYQEDAATSDPNEFVKTLRHYDPETNTFECVPCRLKAHELAEGDEPSENEQAMRPIPTCAGCGLSFLDCDAYVSEAEAQGKDPWEFLRGDPCYNPLDYLFLCPDCWNAAGQPVEMIQRNPTAETGLVPFGPQELAPIETELAETINSDALNAPAGDNQNLYTCKYCGQSSFTPGCSCEGAEAEARREAAERGREEAYHDMAELLFPRFIERDDDGYKSDPNFKMFVAVIDRVINDGLVKATFDIDCENKVTFTMKDYQVQMQLTRTIKTAKSASVA